MVAETKGRMRVLIVDDEKTIATTLAAILKMAGLECCATFSGEEAIEVAKTYRPDLLIADFKMPGINGLETAVAIKKLLPACRVFMLSGHLTESDYDSVRRHGYNFILLSKPMAPAALLEAIRKNSDVIATSGDRPKILNVDDVETHRYSITRMLEHAGFEVLEAGTGSDAIALAIEQNPDLILLDVNLPDVNGFEVCRRLKSDERTAGITVVHLTASSLDPNSQVFSSASGADEFLRQPVDPNVLVTHLRSLLQEKYLRQALDEPESATPES